MALLGPQPETLAMGLSELLVNGVEHGNLGIDFAEKSRLRESDCWETSGSPPDPARSSRTGGLRMRVLGKDEDLLGLRDFRRRDGFDWRRFLDFDPSALLRPTAGHRPVTPAVVSSLTTSRRATWWW